MLSLNKLVVEEFDEEQWLDLALLLDKTAAVRRHPRLLKSVRFGDGDVAANAIEVLDDIVGPLSLQTGNIVAAIERGRSSPVAIRGR